MLTTLATLAGLALAQQTDTTVPVRAGARLEVNNFGGEIAVKTWSKSAVRIAASHSSRDRIIVDASDQVVRVKSEGRRGPSQVVDYDITVPAAMALALSGVYTDISVEGTEGEITAETVQGTVKVSGGSGNVSLKSVQGDVTLEKARGRIDLSSVNETIKASQISGDISAETVNGDISLVQIESGNTEATTVNGDVMYDGTIKDGGRYRFSTHDGDLRVSIPEKSSVSVSVSTFDGDFSACFPVQLVGPKTKHRFTLTIGSGSARLELESFNGDIRLCRPGQLAKDKDWRAKNNDWDKNKDHDNDQEEE
jgi:Putative adhesin